MNPLPELLRGKSALLSALVVLAAGLWLIAAGISDLLQLRPGASSAPPTAPAPPQPLAPVDEPTAAAPRQNDLAREIVARHLFGRATGSPALSASKAPPTRLALKLRGVVAMGDGQGVALIAGTGHGEEVYASGDEISSGVLLQEVRPDHVILSRNGRLERLDLPRGPSAFTLKESAPSLSRQPDSPARALRQLRQEAVRNPSRLGQLIRISPARKDGRLVGYRIEPRGNQPLFEQLGFQPGDVVVAVNGTPLDDPRQNLKVMRELMQARQFQVTVLRDGQELQITQSLE